ncbi:hypothetical protein NLM27_38905 [Bradyrhizobium sp. CCGB12]|uniref:hypothetical protein n=1 Tax=Bradyrhizobium sp. CCGB12 TaxID=2949632 RepID=UPI0020B3D458|nr:hypothetical protein [Bradyrhizobium sp. CCGB12]MCP3394727.1 hypothetical protein [Bradyrhizobium sp. CCGB12]
MSIQAHGDAGGLAKLLDLPPLAAGVAVLLSAMPTDANAYIFAVQYQRLVNRCRARWRWGLCWQRLPVVVAGVK